jgi:hypothetical protein
MDELGARIRNRQNFSKNRLLSNGGQKTELELFARHPARICLELCGSRIGNGANGTTSLSTPTEDDAAESEVNHS